MKLSVRLFLLDCFGCESIKLSRCALMLIYRVMCPYALQERYNALLHYSPRHQSSSQGHPSFPPRKEISRPPLRQIFQNPDGFKVSFIMYES